MKQDFLTKDTNDLDKILKYLVYQVKILKGSSGEGITLEQLNDGLSTKLDIGTGIQSSSTYRRGDGTWATPTNTTYSIITEAEFNTGTSVTARTVSALSLNRDIQAKIISYLLSLPNATAGNTLTINTAGTGFEWVSPGV